jgi:hypothetical protein
MSLSVPFCPDHPAYRQPCLKCIDRWSKRRIVAVDFNRQWLDDQEEQEWQAQLKELDAHLATRQILWSGRAADIDMFKLKIAVIKNKP